MAFKQNLSLILVPVCVNSDICLVCRRMVTSAEPIRLQIRMRPIFTVCFVLIVMDLVFVAFPCELIFRRWLYSSGVSRNFVRGGFNKFS